MKKSNAAHATKTAGIREFKAHLSMYLRQVEAGDVVWITDRGRVVAEIHAPQPATPSSTAEEMHYRQFIVSGDLIPAVTPKDRTWLKYEPLKLDFDEIKSLLDAERGEP
jgi:antitoxin (DNA-binding transcriptional repressor) of toxin-antitoxin stability system